MSENGCSSFPVVSVVGWSVQRIGNEVSHFVHANVELFDHVVHSSGDHVLKSGRAGVNVALAQVVELVKAELVLHLVHVNVG